ncbi:MAG: SpoIIE family protein phosphatase [Sedimentisphaerales bacterium]|nr:SpoIIE family protein phosphatase [Sedimentisphaerales bacterium]
MPGKIHNWIRGLPGGVAKLDKQVRKLNSNLSSVHTTTQLLTGPMQLEQVLEIVSKTITDALGVDAAAIRLLDAEHGTLELKATYGLSEAYRNKGPVSVAQSELNLRILNGETVVVYDMQSDSHFQKYHDQVVAEGLVSNLSIPLRYHDRGIGFLRLYTRRPRRFSKNDISLAQTVAMQSAAAIENARLYSEALEGERMARQVRLAGVVQRHLIPKSSPKLEGYDLAGQYVPCYDVGGDLYDYVVTGDGRLVLIIGDVMGKGVPASLAMASVRSSIRAFSEFLKSPEEMVKRVNRMFCRDTIEGEFATLFCANLELATGKMSYCNAGHNYPLLFRGDEVIELRTGGTILGVNRELEYEAGEIEMQGGDFLLLYTDGLAEAVNFEREPFGVERIVQAVRDSRHLPAEQATRNILWTMRKFTGLTRRFDDTAVIALKRDE